MVDTVIDPIRMPTVTLSQAELEEIEQMMAGGVLPNDWIERHYKAVQDNVFGFDHKTDQDGNPIEQGRGSAVNMTKQAVDAYAKWGKGEKDYDKHLDRMKSELADSDRRRKAAAQRSNAKARR